jgi:hypothetical protein
MAVASTILYLDKNHGFLILHDQVDLTETAGKIPLQQRKALGQ